MDPDPQDPHVFGPPGSGSKVRIRILIFSHEGEIMLAKLKIGFKTKF
jgi:hypothetical protein